MVRPSYKKLLTFYTNHMKKWLIILIVSAHFLNICSQTIIPYGSAWKYVKGKSAVSSSWLSTSFNTSSWSIGNAPFWYGSTGSGGTQLTDMQNSYTTVYLRKDFEVTIPDSLIGYIVANFKYDDGFRIWINGTLAFERNAPASNNYDAVAPNPVNVINPPEIDSIKASAVNLVTGKNVICVLLYNVSLTSSDIYFDLQLSNSSIKNLPKTPDVVFSHPGGYYSSSFNLTLSGEKAGDTIKYTLDYSDPRTSATAITRTSPVTVLIDPNSTANRPATPAVVVRAVVYKEGYRISNPETRTYIFLNKVLTQSYPGGNWPSTNVNNQILDYAMDSRVVNDNRYKNLFPTVFSAIPTVSIVTDNANLFDPSIGIYVNALNHGEAWERPASIEMIETNNTEVFSANIGLRIRGGWSRNAWNPKHAFRIFFNDSYGKKRLNYPIFGTDAAQSFKKFDLRCAQNYSWSFYNNPLMTYAQDETCRDLQGLMGHPYSRSRYCHLFLNGMYWGLFEFQERPEANFAESYKGGDADDYDVIKVATDAGYTIEATDGTTTKWQLVYNLCNQGFANNTNYYRLQGLNSNGFIDTTLEKLVDIENLVDYMLNIFYSGNFDSPVSEFGGNDMPNNFYAIKNRNAKREGFFFIVHDAEHTFNYIAGSEQSKNDGVYENRVSLENDGMTRPAFNKFHPQWLHYRLTENENYRLLFADRAVKYLFNNGLLTPTEVEKVFRTRANQIDMAIIGESARWGDTNNGTLRTRDDDWIPAVNNTVNQFIKKRTPIVINQLKAANLLPELDFPIIKSNGVSINSNKVNLTSSVLVSITNPNTNGSIYYTLDGSDPRTVEGNISGSAQMLQNDQEITISYPTILRTRIYYNNKWSAMREVVFTNKNNRQNIKITEIQYSPKPYKQFGSKSLEFIEFKNTGIEGVDLSGCRIDSGVNFVFPEGTIVPPKGFVVVAADITAFETMYFTSPTGRFSGNIANEGERIRLVDENNQPIIDFNFHPVNLWPDKTDSTGYSLVARENNPAGNPNDTDYWKVSAHLYGSPFADDDKYVKPTNIKTNSSFTCDVFPNPATDYFTIKLIGEPIQKIEIIDLQGRLKYEQSVEKINYFHKEFDTRSLQLTKGIYFIKIATIKGQYIQKLVIK